jgi:two-component system cell cycle response regulator
MYQLATTDALTGVRNKEFLFHDGPEFLKKHEAVCLMMVDIDKLEHINSSYGHITGDHVLHMIGHYLNEYFDTQETVIARFGGKKFTVLLANCHKENAETLADKLREKVMMLRPDDMEVTVSIGLAVTGKRKISLNRLIMSADDALENAKQQGLNRVFTAKEVN